MCIQNQCEEHYGEIFLLSVSPPPPPFFKVCWSAVFVIKQKTTQLLQTLKKPNRLLLIILLLLYWLLSTFINMLLFLWLSYLLFWNEPSGFIKFCFPVDAQSLFDHGEFRDISAQRYFGLFHVLTAPFQMCSNELGFLNVADVWWWRSELNILFLIQRTEKCKTEWG